MRHLKFIAFLLLSSQVYAASVGCTKASNWLEKAICKQPELKELNDQLSEVYKAALNNSKNPEIIKNEQSVWLQSFIGDKYIGYDNNEARCTYESKADWNCIGIFKKRIAELQRGDKREKLGDCRDDRIKDRWKNGYGDTSLMLQSGIYIGVDQHVIPTNDFNTGNKVKICLKHIIACPMDDNRGKIYSLQSYKDPRNIITGLNASHFCGGA